LFTILWALVNLQSGFYILEVFLEYPFALSYGDLAYHPLGHKGKIIVGTLTFSMITLNLGVYLVLIAETLSNIFYSTIWCSTYWSLIACAEVLPFLQLRLLSAMWLLLLINTACILISVFITLGALTSEGVQQSLASRNATTEAIASNLDIYNFYQAMAMFAFSYSGGKLYRIK